MKKLIKNVTAVTANRKNDVIKNACIAIEEDTIISVGQTEPEGKFEVVDGRGGIAMPGLVNAHTHVSMTLLRSYADGLPLQKWLNEKIFPVEDRLTAVSYTHLDVYKRQRYDCFGSKKLFKRGISLHRTYLQN